MALPFFWRRGWEDYIRVFWLQVLTPSPYGHSPYIVSRHRGRVWYPRFVAVAVFLSPLFINPSVLWALPLYFVLRHPAMLRGTAGWGVRHLCSIVVSASPLLRTVSPIFCFVPRVRKGWMPCNATGHGGGWDVFRFCPLHWFYKRHRGRGVKEVFLFGSPPNLFLYSICIIFAICHYLCILLHCKVIPMWFIVRHMPLYSVASPLIIPLLWESRREISEGRIYEI